jgi:hypothetical protein
LPPERYRRARTIRRDPAAETYQRGRRRGETVHSARRMTRVAFRAAQPECTSDSALRAYKTEQLVTRGAIEATPDQTS